MTHALESRSPRETEDPVCFESPGNLIGSLGEVLASSASQSFEVRMKAWLWLERHGEAAARALTSTSAPRERLQAECACRQEQPLALWESELLGLRIRTSCGALTPREVGVLRASLGVDGPPRALAKIALELGLTRERVRQIESRALAKLGIGLPKRMQRSPGGRWKRARMVLRELAGTPRFTGTASGPDAASPEAHEARP